MWYSETLIIVHKARERNTQSTNRKIEDDVKNTNIRNHDILRKHNCANYGGLCRDLTCPESPKHRANNYNLSKTRNGRITIKVIRISMTSSLLTLFCFMKCNT